MTWPLTETVIRSTGKLLAATLGTILLGFLSVAYLWRAGPDAKLLAAFCEGLAFAFYVATVVSLLRLRKKASDARRGSNSASGGS